MKLTHYLSIALTCVLSSFCFVNDSFALPLPDFVVDKFIFPGKNIRPANYQVMTEKMAFNTTDGTSLSSDIYHPRGLPKTPTLLVRIPFSDTFSNRLRSDVIARYWAGRGYTVVIQGTRGRYRSEGQFYPLMHERQDGIDTFQWITKQPWYDGRLGMWGGSAFGHTQWAVADQTTPGPQALFIHIASTNFHDMFYPGNALSLESALYWAIRSRGIEDREVEMDDLDKGVNHLPIIEADDVAIGDTDFFNDWLLNQNNATYWQKVDGKNRAATLQAPVLLMGGWFDPFLPTQIQDFINIRTHAKSNVAAETRLIIGPWGHAKEIKLPGSKQTVAYRPASVVPSIPWFDYVLGVNTTPLSMPRVKIFVMGENRWRDENEWPLARTQYTSFYLHSNGNANTLDGDGRLSDQKPTNTQNYPDRYIYRPSDPVPTKGGALLSNRAGIQIQNAIELRKDVLVYTTPILSQPIETTGPIMAILYVATDASSTDFTAKLVDVHPNGNVYNVSDGILRRNYVKTANNAPIRIEIQLWPTSHVFLKGHQIRLEISSSNFPRYDRNPNTGAFPPTATTMQDAKQMLFHNANYPSQLILPVIPLEP